MKLFALTVLEVAVAVFATVGFTYADRAQPSQEAKAVIAPHRECVPTQAYPNSGDRVLIGDMYYVLIQAGDWCALTSTVGHISEAYAKMNATEEGRVAIHGRRGHCTITNGVEIAEFADGYRITNAIPRKTASKARITRPNHAVTNVSRVVSRPIAPERLRKIQELREAAKKAVPREVTEFVGGGK